MEYEEKIDVEAQVAMIHVNQRKRRSMLQVLVFWTIWHGTFQGSPIICNMVFILLDLGLEALQSNNFTERRFVGKFISLSLGFPNSPRFVG